MLVTLVNDVVVFLKKRFGFIELGQNLTDQYRSIDGISGSLIKGKSVSFKIYLEEGFC